jgi:hypothetical protein
MPRQRCEAAGGGIGTLLLKAAAALSAGLLERRSASNGGSMKVFAKPWRSKARRAAFKDEFQGALLEPESVT